MRNAALTDDELWLLSFYRTSEIAGALFFGRLARLLKPGDVQADMTQHFADEANHAALWTHCINDLGSRPIKMRESYQDSYLEAAGLPVNMMEILSITHAFERRVAQQYSRHEKAIADIHPEVAATLRRIMKDERWHLSWVRDALKALEPRYGSDHVKRTMARHVEADREVFGRLADEQGERLEALGLKGAWDDRH